MMKDNESTAVVCAQWKMRVLCRERYLAAEAEARSGGSS